jgi:hypothetical protein
VEHQNAETTAGRTAAARESRWSPGAVAKRLGWVVVAAWIGGGMGRLLALWLDHRTLLIIIGASIGVVGVIADHFGVFDDDRHKTAAPAAGEGTTSGG